MSASFRQLLDYMASGGEGESPLESLAARITQLEQQTPTGFWPDRQSLIFRGVVEGHGQWDGRQPLEIEMTYGAQGLKVDQIEGLGIELLNLRRAISGKTSPGDTIAQARRLSMPVTFTFEGDVTGSVRFDGSSAETVAMDLSTQWRQRIENTFTNMTVLDRDTQIEALTQSGLFYYHQPSSTRPRDHAVIWNAYHDEMGIRVQFLQSMQDGHFYTRTERQGKSLGWDRVWTERTLDVTQLAHKSTTFNHSTHASDFNSPSRSTIVKWGPHTRNGFDMNGTYFEFNSEGHQRGFVVGNVVHRLSISDKNRVRLHVNRNGEGFQTFELLTSLNMDLDRKVDRTHPDFNRHISVTTVDQLGRQPVFRAGWMEGHPHWSFDLEEDGSYSLTALKVDQSGFQRIMRWHSPLNGGSDRVDLLTRRQRLGRRGEAAMYGFALDDWGFRNEKIRMGWGTSQQFVTSIDKVTGEMTHVGGITAAGAIQGRRLFASWDAGIDGGMSCENWFRSSGSSGWMNATHNGGWHMTDSQYLRSWYDKPVLTGGFVLRLPVRMSTPEPTVFRGALQPATYMDPINHQPHVGFNWREMAQLYPELFTVEGPRTNVDLLGIVSVLSAQVNAQQDTIAAMDQRMIQLEQRLETLLNSLGE